MADSRKLVLELEAGASPAAVPGWEHFYGYGVAGWLLRAGRVRLSGTAPSRQDFFADLRRIWLIEGSTAAVDGVDLGESGPVAKQARLGDLWLPQRGLFAIGGSFFAAYDPSRHEQVASRHELAGAALRP